MYAADRACVNTLAHAQRSLRRSSATGVGVAVDVYHVWWDPDLAAPDRARRQAHPHLSRLRLAGADHATCCSTAACRATASSTCAAIRAMVEATGYDGLIDVEIFSAQNWWKREPAEVLRICLERHQTVV